MLKLGRKSKKISGGIIDEVPPEQDNLENGSSEDCITPMPAAYSMTNTNLNYPVEVENSVVRQATSARRQSSKKTLPPLFIYIEAGDYQRAAERAKRHPREARTWASIKIKSSSGETTKRLALHQACFKVSFLFSRRKYFLSLVFRTPLVCFIAKSYIRIFPRLCSFIDCSSGLPVLLRLQQKKIRSSRSVVSFFS